LADAAEIERKLKIQAGMWKIEAKCE